MNVLLTCLRTYVVLAILTGLIYPLAVTLPAQLFFRAQAEGALVSRGSQVVGSAHLAQKTEGARYFWPRPSAGDYATVASGASNLGPSSAALEKALTANEAKVRSANDVPPTTAIPGDAITTSGSGLDPDISPAAARLQIGRVARARGFSAEQKSQLEALVEAQVEGPQLGFLGEPRVNVLLLNLALDRLR